MALEARQKLFVKEYLKRRNATQAAIAAGYSKKNARSIGAENLSKPAIKSAIEEGLKKLEEKCDISAERTIREIAEIAYQKLNKNELKKISANKLRALELIGKHFKMFTEVQDVNAKVEHSGVSITVYENGSEAKDK